MSQSTEHIATGMAVLTSCLLLGGPGVVQQYQQVSSGVGRGLVQHVVSFSFIVGGCMVVFSHV